MTSTPKKSTEAEDVLEFLNSLPENKEKPIGAFKAKSNKTSGGGGGKDDVLDFLDELEKSTGKKKGDDNKTEKEPQEPAPGKKEESEQETAEDIGIRVDETGDSIENTENEGDDFIDPISSISNWWSSSGSSAVNSLWNNAKQIQQKATEEASKFATEAGKKLNDEKEHVERLRKVNAFKFLSENFESLLGGFDKYDEFLKIHLIHDLINFDNLEKSIQVQFKRVLKQVEGDIFIEVVKEGTVSEDGQRRYSVGAHNSVKKLNLFEGGVRDGDKLNWANLNASIRATDSNAKSTESKSEESTESEKNQHADESNPESNLNISKLYISILPIQNIAKSTESEEEYETIDSHSPKSFQFRIILKDAGHGISLVSETQSFPIKWAKWIEYDEDFDKNKEEGSRDDRETEGEKSDSDEIDPAEWVKDWIDQGLALTIGVLAQEYVIKRMAF